MTAADAAPDLETDLGLHAGGKTSDTAFFGHPKGLGYLSFVEGCERFSYYSMQTLLVLYMVQYLLLPANAGSVIGLEWVRTHLFHSMNGQPLASEIFGLYTSLVYLTPIAGGIIADRWLGRRTTLIVGGVVMAIGHLLMAVPTMFLFALLALIVGVGLFKGNIASQVGELYSPGDIRRAMAFQIFYIFINVSVIIAPPITGTLGQRVSWHWGFGTAGVVMVLGLLLYLRAKPWLPVETPRGTAVPSAEPATKLTRGDVPRLLALAAMVPIMAISLLPNQQISNVYLVWATQQFHLRIFGFDMPSTWLVGVDAAVSFAMLVAVAWFWKAVGKRTGREPDELGKMVIGSVFTIAGAMCLVIAAATQGSGKIGLFWPLMFHLLNGIGFAHILPISLALFTKVAPRALNATIVGIYYLAFFGANYAVGQVGVLFATMSTVNFWLIHVGAAIIGMVGFAGLKLVLGRTLSQDPAG